MTDVVFVFEVHQPHRLRRNLFWEGKVFRRQTKQELFNYYFDNEVDREIFKRAARKCYFPSNQIILDTIDRHKHEKKQAKFAFSCSGVYLAQCEMFGRDLLVTFLQLAATDAEFQPTGYHSIASLYPRKRNTQAQMHRQTVKDLSATPQRFENTELLQQHIAKTVEDRATKASIRRC